MTDYDLLADLGVILPLGLDKARWHQTNAARTGRGDPCGDPPIDPEEEHSGNPDGADPAAPG